MSSQIELKKHLKYGILNQQFLKKYESVNFTLFLEDFKILLKMKPKSYKSRSKMQLFLKQKMAKIITMTQDQEKLLLSQKKTDNSKFFKLFAYKDNQCIRKIEKLRKKILDDCRTKHQINFQEYLIVAQVLVHFGIIDEIQESQANIKHEKLKKDLTILRRMMGNYDEQTVKSQFKEQRVLSYQLNLDMRKLLLKASKILEGSRQSIQLQKLVAEHKNKKWLGSRFHKCLSSQIWDASMLKNLYLTLKKIKITEDITQNLEIFQPVFCKLLNNIQQTIKLQKKYKKKHRNQTEDIETNHQTQQIHKIQTLDGQFVIKNMFQFHSQPQQFDQMVQVTEQFLKFENKFSLLDQLCQSIMSIE